MGRLKRNLLSIQLALFAAVVIVRSLTLFFVTSRDLRRTGLLLEENLYRKGLTLVRTVEAGARTGMMSSMFGRDFTQRLLLEASSEPDVKFIHVVDEGGMILTSSLEGEALSIGPLPQGLDDGFPRRRLAEGPGGLLMLIYKEFNRPPRGATRHERMMGRRTPEIPPEKEYIVLAMSMEPVEEAKGSALKSAYLSGFILLATIVGSILIFGMAQNYFLLRRRLAATRSYTDRIVQGMADGLLALDSGGMVTVSNRESQRILDARDKKPLGRGVNSPIREPFSDVSRALETGEIILGRSLIAERDGRRMKLEYSITPLWEEGEVSGAVILMRDVGEMEDLREKVKEGEKLAALGRMAAAVAHEVRNPLSSIKGFAQFLAGRFTDGSKEKDHASVIVDEVNRLDRFVEELLTFVRPVRPHTVPTDLSTAVEEIVSLIREEASSRGVEISFSMKGDLPEVALDRDLFKRALLNILINSIDALGDQGGEITISAEEIGEGVVLRVADNGPGLPEGAGDKVFESFYSTKPEGTGLGLAVVRQVAESHGWAFELKNAPGGGAVNIITIPLPGAEAGR